MRYGLNLSPREFSIVPRYPSGVLGPARTYPNAYSRCSGAHAARKDPLPHLRPQLVRVPAQPGPGHGSQRNSRATSLPGDAVQRSHPRTRTQPMLASQRSRSTRLSKMRTTIMDCLDELASLHTHPPLACGLRSVSMTKPTMGLQGQTEQPMMLHGRSVSSMVPDAPAPSTLVLDEGGGQGVVSTATS